MLSRPSTPDSVKQKAIEKAESGEKVTVADVKDWKAELEAEKQRSSEWRDQWKKQRDETEQTLGRLSIALQEKSELQFKLRALENQPAPKPQVVEKAPDDYEEFKCKAVEFQQQTDALQQQLATLQKQQARLVNDQVKAKLQEREYRATSPPARAQRSRLNARPG